MNQPQLVGHLKSGEAIYGDSEGYSIEKNYTYLTLPTEEELAEILEIVKGEK